MSCSPHTPVARLEDNEALRAAALRPIANLIAEIAAIIGIVEFAIIHAPPERALLVAKMPHRREEEGEPALVLRDINRLLPHLHLQNRVMRRIKAVEGGGLPVELIAQHDDEMSELHLRLFRRRQKSSQAQNAAQSSMAPRMP